MPQRLHVHRLFSQQQHWTDPIVADWNMFFKALRSKKVYRKVGIPKAGLIFQMEVGVILLRYREFHCRMVHYSY